MALYNFSNESRNTYVQTNVCRHCKEVNSIIVDMEAFTQWRTGKLFIQDAFPHLSADDREVMISGTHIACWNEMFPEK